MSVIFIFIDGVGVGKSSLNNPLSGNKWSFFSSFTGTEGLNENHKPVQTDKILYKPIDANLDVEGLPQSGTGQTSLFSGINASKIAGKHYGPFPYTTTRYLLEQESLFHKVIDIGIRPLFMNAYPEIFFRKARKKDRWTATTLMTRSAGILLKTTRDVLNGEAVTAEIRQNIWREHLDLEVPIITVHEAADRLLRATRHAELVLYEFYLTDKAGHGMNRVFADEIRDLLDPFLNHLVSNIKETDTLVISSDHGNLEDLSTKSHTRNPVPLLVKGETAFFWDAESITDVTPGIVKLFKESSPKS